MAPEVRILAWGGPRMRGAGAEVVRDTCDNAAMGLPGARKIWRHVRLHSEFKTWLASQRIDLHVPVDSPAVNTPMCKATKSRGVRVVHLVAPQMWAWASWRVHRLRRLTDRALCLLPFEPEWFAARGVSAEFIGHPLFDETLDGAALDGRALRLGLSQGSPRIALMPGSRQGELKANFPVMLEAFRALRRARPSLVGVVAATTQETSAALRAMAAKTGGWPEGLKSAAGEIAAVIRWCDIAIAVSGTVTLHIARQRRPMIVVYAMPRLTGWVARHVIVKAPYVALPNVIAGREIVPELFPYTGGPGRLVETAQALLDDEAARSAQRAALDRLCSMYDNRNAGDAAARAILKAVGAWEGADPARSAAGLGAGAGDVEMGPEGVEPSRGLTLSGF